MNVKFTMVDWNEIFGLKFVRQLVDEQEEKTDFTNEFKFQSKTPEEEKEQK